jgi:hypothetical protein
LLGDHVVRHRSQTCSTLLGLVAGDFTLGFHRSGRPRRDAARTAPPLLTKAVRAALPLPRERQAPELPAATGRELPGGPHRHFHGISAGASPPSSPGGRSRDRTSPAGALARPITGMGARGQRVGGEVVAGRGLSPATPWQEPRGKAAPFPRGRHNSHRRRPPLLLHPCVSPRLRRSRAGVSLTVRVVLLTTAFTAGAAGRQHGLRQPSPAVMRHMFS